MPNDLPGEDECEVKDVDETDPDERYNPILEPRGNMEARKTAAIAKTAQEDEWLTIPADLREPVRDSDSGLSSRPVTHSPVERDKSPVSRPISTAPDPEISLPQSSSQKSPPAVNASPSINSSTEHLQPQPASLPDDANKFGSLSSFPAPPTHIPILNENLPHRPAIPQLTHAQSSRPPPDSKIDMSEFGRVSDPPLTRWSATQTQSLPDTRRPSTSPFPRHMPDSPQTPARVDDDHEFGVRRNPNGGGYVPTSSNQYAGVSTVDEFSTSNVSKAGEITDSVATNATGSKVAAIRSRYSYNVRFFSISA